MHQKSNRTREIEETTKTRCQHRISETQAETQQAGLRVLQPG